MSNTFSNIWIHTFFGTKDGLSLIDEKLEPLLYFHIKSDLSESFNCKTRIINGTSDHIHILFMLNPNFSVKDIIKNIKGESSHWINQNNLTEGKFSWQVGYLAHSVSAVNLKKAEIYIKNQKEYHKTHTFKEEYDNFIIKHMLV